MNKRPTPANRIIRNPELTRLSAVAGRGHAVRGQSAHSEEVLSGDFTIRRSPSGLMIHTTDGLELQDMTSTIELPAGVGFGVVLQGRVDFAIGGHAHHVDVPPGAADRRDDCFAINLLKPTLLERRLHRGAHVRKVNINVAHAWLEAQLADHVEDRKVMRFLNRHLAVPHWRATAALRRPAEQILAPPRYHGALQTLYTEGRALEIIAASLQAVNRLKHNIEPMIAAPRKSGYNPSHQSRLREYIETRLLPADAGGTPQSLETIAGELGMSVSKVQRLCKHLYGKTLFDYVRQRRLEMARDAIEHRRVSIGEAAFIAGYRHSSNFANAFKRAFGISPGALQPGRVPSTGPPT